MAIVGGGNAEWGLRLLLLLFLFFGVYVRVCTRIRTMGVYYFAIDTKFML